MAGGYQRPSNPSPVALPGALSKRTDGGPADKQPMRSLPNPAYGEGKEFMEIQRGASMAGMPSPSAPPPSGFFDETSRPDEPVTAGAPTGDGPNRLRQEVDRRSLSQLFAEASARDGNGDFDELQQLAERLGL